MTSRTLLRLVLLATSVIGTVILTSAQTPPAPQTFWDAPQILNEPPDTTLGIVMAMDGDLLAVVADDPTFDVSRVVYVYRNVGGTWVEEARLGSDFAGPFAVFDGYGASVAVDAANQRIAVGSDDYEVEDVDIGVVFIYEHNGQTWEQTAKLTDSTGVLDDSFGSSVALDGNTLIVGADGVNVTEDDFILGRGAMLLFTYDGQTWNEVTKYSPPDDDIDGFGRTMTFDGQTLVVGTTNWIGTSNIPGFVYVFDVAGQNITPVTRLDSGTHLDGFGVVLAVQGNLIAVGASAADDEQLGNNLGAVYLYERSQDDVDLVDTLRPADVVPGDFFGTSLALDDDILVVSARNQDNGGDRRGGVYIYQRLDDTNFQQTDKLTTEPGADFDWFGQAVTLDNGIMAISEPYRDTEFFTDTGYVYVYDTVLDAPTGLVATSAGQTQINLTWTPSAQAASYRLERSPANLNTWTTIADDLTATAFNDITVLCGSSYDYRAVAVSTYKEATSNVASATTDNCTIDFGDVIDGGFENDPVAAGWKINNGTKDKVKCNKIDRPNGKPDKIFSYEGDCAFQFKGGPAEKSRLIRKINVEEQGIGDGDLLVFSVMIDAGEASNIRIKGRAKYTDRERDKFVIFVDPAEGYTRYTTCLEFNRPVRDLKFIAIHRSLSGKVYLDDINVQIVVGGVGEVACELPTTTRTPDLPTLPASPDTPSGFRG